MNWKTKLRRKAIWLPLLAIAVLTSFFFIFLTPQLFPKTPKSDIVLSRDSIERICKCHPFMEKMIDIISPEESKYAVSIVCDTLKGDDSLKVFAAASIARIFFNAMGRDTLHYYRFGVFFRKKGEYFGEHLEWVFKTSDLAKKMDCTALAARHLER